MAKEVIAAFEAAKLYDDPIVTEVAPIDQFYKAEAYHQGYYRANPNQGYCRVVIAPKVARARKVFVDRLKTPA